MVRSRRKHVHRRPVSRRRLTKVGLATSAVVALASPFAAIGWPEQVRLELSPTAGVVTPDSGAWRAMRAATPDAEDLVRPENRSASGDATATARVGSTARSGEHRADREEGRRRSVTATGRAEGVGAVVARPQTDPAAAAGPSATPSATPSADAVSARSAGATPSPRSPQGSPLAGAARSTAAPTGGSTRGSTTATADQPAAVTPAPQPTSPADSPAPAPDPTASASAPCTPGHAKGAPRKPLPPRGQCAAK